MTRMLAPLPGPSRAMRDTAALAMVALSALALTACAGGTKMSANGTARWIEQHSHYDDVSCVPAAHWDYRCRLGIRSSFAFPKSAFYNVDAHKVTDTNAPALLGKEPA